MGVLSYGKEQEALAIMIDTCMTRTSPLGWAFGGGPSDGNPDPSVVNATSCRLP